MKNLNTNIDQKIIHRFITAKGLIEKRDGKHINNTIHNYAKHISEAIKLIHFPYSNMSSISKIIPELLQYGYKVWLDNDGWVYISENGLKIAKYKNFKTFIYCHEYDIDKYEISKFENIN